VRQVRSFFNWLGSFPSLLLRGSRDFNSQNEYAAFLNRIYAQLNAGRQDRFKEEVKILGRLPAKRLDDFKRMTVSVRSSSTIRIQNNVYSVNSRLINEKVRVYLYANRLEVWYAQKLIENLPRIRGDGKALINYRHIIDWLVRKPGAFENYLYKASLFPSHLFRMAYDSLVETLQEEPSREYLSILYLAAKESESGVEDALRYMFEKEQVIIAKEVEKLLKAGLKITRFRDVEIQEVDLAIYDQLIEEMEVSNV